MKVVRYFNLGLKLLTFLVLTWAFSGVVQAQMMGHGRMMEGMGPSRHMGPYGASPFDVDFLKDVLNLNDEQVSKLKKLRSEYRKEMIRRRAELRVAELELWELIDSGRLDMGKLEKKVRQVESIRSDILMYRIKVLKEAKGFLTDEQFEKFREMGFRSMRHGMRHYGTKGHRIPKMHRGMMPPQGMPPGMHGLPGMMGEPDYDDYD